MRGRVFVCALFVQACEPHSEAQRSADTYDAVVWRGAAHNRRHITLTLNTLTIYTINRTEKIVLCYDTTATDHEAPTSSSCVRARAHTHKHLCTGEGATTGKCGQHVDRDHSRSLHTVDIFSWSRWTATRRRIYYITLFLSLFVWLFLVFFFQIVGSFKISIWHFRLTAEQWIYVATSR